MATRKTSRPKAKKKPVPPKKPAARPVKPRPRQARLPGTEDNRIAAIETAAEHYASVRDERMSLSKQEHEAKDDVHAAMRKAGKTHYSRGGITVDIVPEEETVKVRIKPAGEESDEDEFPDTAPDGVGVKGQPESAGTGLEPEDVPF